MPYADADFFFALVKPTDWLKQAALAAYKEHTGKIVTSVATIIELALVCKRLKLDVERVIADVFTLAHVIDCDADTALHAAHLIKNERFTVFDAFHAAYAVHDTIITSDGTYARVGIPVINLSSRT